MCLKCAEKAALRAMLLKAQEMKLHGAAAVLTTTAETESGMVFDPLIAAVERFVDTPDICDWSETGANYIGIVMAKIAEMLETHKASGHAGRPVRVGEMGYRGGATETFEDVTGYFAFSGGEADEDWAVANAGLTAFRQALDELARSREEMLDMFEALLDGAVLAFPMGRGNRRDKHFQ